MTSTPRPLQCTSCHSEIDVDPSIVFISDEESAETSGENDQQRPSNHDNQASTLGQLVAMQGNLFDLIADAEKPLDVPMCQECASALLNCLDDQLAAAEKECAEYRHVLDNLKSQKASPDQQQQKRSVRQAELEEESLRQQVEELLDEERALDAQIEGVERERRDQNKTLDELYIQFRDMSQSLVDLHDENRSLTARHDYARTQLSALKRVNALNLAFHIWADQSYGFINGLRLGRMGEPCDVEWHEVNAAFGHAAALLVALAAKFNLTFRRYEPVPMFASSCMRPIGDDANSEESDSLSTASSSHTASATSSSTQLRAGDGAGLLPLYSSGGAKWLGNPKFDAAIVGFVDCLQQVQDEMQKKLSQRVCFPYALSKDKVANEQQNRVYSVKTQFNSAERWTKAMKYLLINMKYALAYAACERQTP